MIFCFDEPQVSEKDGLSYVEQLFTVDGIPFLGKYCRTIFSGVEIYFNGTKIAFVPKDDLEPYIDIMVETYLEKDSTFIDIVIKQKNKALYKKKRKFRGKNKNGEYVFIEFEEPFSFNGESVNEVVQLVGYDADGAEVYEGDRIIEYYEPYVGCPPEEIVKFEMIVNMTTSVTDVVTNGGGYALDDRRRVCRLKK